jgi:Zinc-binding dehydrogenase
MAKSATPGGSSTLTSPALVWALKGRNVTPADGPFHKHRRQAGGGRLTLAIANQVPLEGLAETVHCYPTRAGVFQRIALEASALGRPPRPTRPPEGSSARDRRAQRAAGSVGACATQMAKDAGASVYGTARAREVERGRALGAEPVVEGDEVGAQLASRSLDAVIDTIGGDAPESSCKALRPNGIIVSVVGAPDAAHLRSRGVRAAYFIVDVTRDRLDRISAMVERGTLSSQCRPGLDGKSLAPPSGGGCSAPRRAKRDHHPNRRAFRPTQAGFRSRVRRSPRMPSISWRWRWTLRFATWPTGTKSCTDGGSNRIRSPSQEPKVLLIPHPVAHTPAYREPTLLGQAPR